MPGTDFISRAEADDLVERVAESTRREFTSAITTVQVQIGATEKTLTSKISSAKAWGIAAFLSGQTLAAAIGAYLAPGHVGSTAHAVVRFFSL